MSLVRFANTKLSTNSSGVQEILPLYISKKSSGTTCPRVYRISLDSMLFLLFAFAALNVTESRPRTAIRKCFSEERSLLGVHKCRSPYGWTVE